MRQEDLQRGGLKKNRTTAELNHCLEKKLRAYAAAAGTVGVALLACSSAEAEVVYTRTWISIAPRSLTALDLNNDGMADFQLSAKPNKCFAGTSNTYCATLKVLPQNSNAVWGTGGSASALGSGVSIGSQGKFQAGHEFMAQDYYRQEQGKTYGTYRSHGPWTQTTRAFLGLKFIIQGQIHFGWARLDVTETTKGIYGAITGYAYETQPNTPIRTGQESGGARKGHKASRVPVPAITSGDLGMLAGGAPGLQAQREPNTASPGSQ